MSSKAPPCYDAVVELGGEPDSTARLDDVDDSYAVRALTIALGLYLLITVLFLRAAYHLSRRLVALARIGSWSAPQARRPDSGRFD